MHVDHDAFGRWFAANRRPGLFGAAYEHAMFMRWCALGSPSSQPAPPSSASTTGDLPLFARRPVA